MPKMREVKRTKNGVAISAKTGLPKAGAAKAAAATNNTFIDENGVKVTICKPSPAPKQITARSH